MSDEPAGGSDQGAPATGAVQATVSKFLSLADGTLRLQVDVHHRDSHAALELLCEVGATVAVARLVDSTLSQGAPRQYTAGAVGPGDEEPTTSAREPDPLTGTILAHFYKAGFFQSPKVLKVLGHDAELLQWCRSQVCWHCGKQDLHVDGDGVEHFYVQAAHVRRIAAGSGTSRKPPYSAIPLCSNCHSIQHAVGESGLAPDDWWQSKAADARQEWGHKKLREAFATDSVSRDVSADDLWAWLHSNDLHRYLPAKARRELEQRQREAASGSAGAVGADPVVEG